MKKNSLFFCTVLIALSLTACAYSNKEANEADQPEAMVSQDLASNTEVPIIIKDRISSDFIFDVAPRFNGIKKTDLDKAKSFSEFIADEHANRIVEYYALNVIVLDGDKKTDLRENGTGGDLNEAQIKLLQASDYGTNVLIWADYREKSFETGELENSTWTPYLSVVPEKQAIYKKGKVALIDYLDENSVTERATIETDKLKPATISFAVTKKGTIENAKVNGTSGYPLVDKKLIELISNTSGTWMPAENTEGKKVVQALTISFGKMGC